MHPQPIRVGIVGLTPPGSWAARAHVPALQALPEYEVSAVANSSMQSASRAAEAYGIKGAFGTAAELAVDPGVDLVAVTVKVPHHREIVSAALAAGKPTYCEWPLGRNLHEAVAMADDARTRGVRTAVGLQARSSPTIRYVRDLVRDGFVGEVLSTTLVGSSGSMGAVERESLTYLNEHANGANVLTIPFGHAIDALRWVLGDFTEVSSTLATRRPTYVVAETSEVRSRDIADQVAVTGILTSGAVVSAHYRGGTCRGTNLRWEINGTEGDLVITGASGHIQATDLSVRGARGDASGLEALEIPNSYRRTPPQVTGVAVNVAEAYLRYAQAPAADDPVPTFDDAVSLHRLLATIEDSHGSTTSR